MGVLGAGPLPCSDGQPMGLEVPLAVLVSAQQPAWGSWLSPLPHTHPASLLEVMAGCRGHGFYDINAKLAFFLGGNIPG